MTFKKLRSTALTVLCIAAFSSPVFADKPSIVYFDAFPTTFTTAQTGCGFDVLATPAHSKEKLTAFVDQNGNPTIFLITGVNLYLLTNLSTGKTISINSSAPGKFTIETADTFHAIVNGTAVLLVAPGVAPGFPQFALTKGRIDMLITPDFTTLQINAWQGNVQDICTLLR
jgi:hypothetical protein